MQLQPDGSALEMWEEVKDEVFEPAPRVGSRQSNSSGHLSTHRHCYASKDMLHTWLTDTNPRPVATEWVSAHWVGRGP